MDTRRFIRQRWSRRQVVRGLGGPALAGLAGTAASPRTGLARGDPPPPTTAYVATPLGTLAGKESVAIGINDHAQVVGWANTARVDPQALVGEDRMAMLWTPTRHG